MDMKLSTYANRQGISYQTAWRRPSNRLAWGATKRSMRATQVKSASTSQQCQRCQ
jgi:hypothetical protein